jgi:hypothetical protein
VVGGKFALPHEPLFDRQYLTCRDAHYMPQALMNLRIWRSSVSMIRVPYGGDLVSGFALD